MDSEVANSVVVGWVDACTLSGAVVWVEDGGVGMGGTLSVTAVLVLIGVPLTSRALLLRDSCCVVLEVMACGLRLSLRDVGVGSVIGPVTTVARLRVPVLAEVAALALVVALAVLLLLLFAAFVILRSPWLDLRSMPRQTRDEIVDITELTVMLTIELVTLTPVDNRNEAIVVNVFVVTDDSETFPKKPPTPNDVSGLPLNPIHSVVKNVEKLYGHSRTRITA